MKRKLIFNSTRIKSFNNNDNDKDNNIVIDHSYIPRSNVLKILVKYYQKDKSNSKEINKEVIPLRNKICEYQTKNDIIENTEVCLWYNNHEFCFKPNYWVETGNGDSEHMSIENGEATKDKLQAAMEAALGIQADNCPFGTSYVRCHFTDFYCGVSSDGGVSCCSDYHGCGVESDGSSECTWY